MARPVVREWAGLLAGRLCDAYCARQAQAPWLLPLAHASWDTTSGVYHVNLNPTFVRNLHHQHAALHAHPAVARHIPQPVHPQSLYQTPQQVYGHAQPPHSNAYADSWVPSCQEEGQQQLEQQHSTLDSHHQHHPAAAAQTGLVTWQPAPAHMAPGSFTSVAPASAPGMTGAEDVDEAGFMYQQYLADWQVRNPALVQAQTEQLARLYMDQLRAEVHAMETGQKRYQQKLQSAGQAGMALHMLRPRHLHKTWSADLAMALKQQLEQMRCLSERSSAPAGSTVTKQSVLWPVLAVVGIDKAAKLTTMVVLQRLMTMVGTPAKASAVSIAGGVGSAVQDAIRWAALRDQLSGTQVHAVGQARLQKMMSALDRMQEGVRSHRAWKHMAIQQAREAADAVRRTDEWSQALQLQVGAELLALLLPVATVPGIHKVAAIEQHMTATGRNSSSHQRVVWPSSALVDYLAMARVEDMRMLLDTRYLPMLVPPRPWKSFRAGGLLTGCHNAVRGYYAQDKGWVHAAEAKGQFDRLFEVLDVLGSTKWRINSQVLRVVERVSSLPERFGTLGTPARQQLPMPQQPGGTPHLRLSREGWRSGQLLVTAGPLLPGEATRLAEARARTKMLNANIMSLASEYDLRLHAAQQLAQRSVFYQPHSIDFRGRAYPLSGYLTHLGDDMSRALMEFGEGRALGPTGLRWLCIQIANCYGHGKDKLSLDDRYAFGLSCLVKCQATATDPLGHAGSWWQEGEDPWQLLATALEVASASRAHSAESYISHLPVHQDGSCNGLQHYAALARDRGGGKAVNLLPTSEPQDVYAAVARQVEHHVKLDAADQVSEALKLLLRNGGVDRKLVKQTVMTTVYGVTYIGAKDQIAARLVERGWNNVAEVDQVSRYLAKITLKAVGQVFANAQLVKAWLSGSASRVAKTGRPVTWTSPIGFPIKQPYMKPASQDGEHRDEEPQMVVDVRAQRTAFPPNFIHSLDAAHMMMTAMACQNQGVAFAGVHDSFFTHAGAVDCLNAILRREFVQLHRQPLLQNLKNELEASGASLDPLPSSGDLDIESVVESRYFFS